MVSRSPGVQGGVSDCLSFRHGICSSRPKTYGRIARTLSLFVVPAELWLWEELGPAPLGRVFLASAITTNRRAPDEVLFRLHQDSRIEQDDQLVLEIDELWGEEGRRADKDAGPEH